MRKIVLSALLAGGLAGLAGCGGTAESSVPAGPLSLSKEQAAAIASTDSRVEDEEGGAFIQKTRAAKARAKTKK